MHLTSLDYVGRMLIFDGQTGDMRTVRLRSRQQNCLACGDNRMTELMNYEQFCGVRNPLNITDRRIAAKEYSDLNIPHILIDCRPRNQFEMGSLPNAIRKKDCILF